MSMAGSPALQQRVECDGLIVELIVDGPPSRSFDGPSAQTDKDIARVESELFEIGAQVDQLTNRADGIDYSVAVASGVLAGVIDSLWVGELSLERGREWGSELINRSIRHEARRQGYVGNDLGDAIHALEQVHRLASDGVTYKFGGGTIHHLRDLTHHPSPLGLAASIVMQFTGKAWGMSDGNLSPVDVSNSPLIGTTVPEKLLFGTIQWFMHLLSDAAGSSVLAGEGTGLPGPLISMLHEASALFGELGPDDQGVLLQKIEKAFRGSGGGVPFDLRTEIGLAKEFGRQSLPVLLNEALVRGFFFVRRLATEIRRANPETFDDLLRVDLAPALPWANRTIVRMLTIAASTATAIDLLDAAVRAAIKSGGHPESPVYWSSFLLRVNVVGLGRTAVAVGVDVRQGSKRSSLRNDQIALMSERLHLLNARCFYRVGDVWLAAGEAFNAVQAAGQVVSAASTRLQSGWAEMGAVAVHVSEGVDRLREANRELSGQLLDELQWGADE